MNKTLSTLLVLFGFILPYSSGFAWNKLGNNIDISCSQVKENLECKYRTLHAVQPSSIKAFSDGAELPVSNENKYLASNGTTAILFLVDTSDPGRQNVIDKNIHHIKELISSAKPNHKIGLATFDKKLTIKSSIGSSNFLLTKALTEIKAKGKTTELYRNILGAIEKLKQFDSDRKVIFLLSDGQAEDKAYFHSDVIKVARKHGIIINSIGYPRSVSLSVALQTLRRLSEETGGKYIETDMSYTLPEDYIKTAYNNIDSGGNFSINLGNIKSDKIKLSLNLSNTSETFSIPVKIESTKLITPVKNIESDKVIKPTVKTTSSKNAPVQIITRQVEQQPVNLWLWYGLPAAFIIIVVFILIVLFLLWNRDSSGKDKKSENEYKPYAYLIAQDEMNTRYPVTRTIWRIGRGKDNELTLDDTSVSRRHAEIHRNANGTFDIIDMNSMNGVYINNEKIGKAILQEGDLIEIGDIFLSFTQFASDFSLEESTVMQKTKTPSLN